MTLNGFQKWMIRQGLGKDRYTLIIGILEGPIGIMIDAVLKGRPSEVLAQASKAQAHLEEILKPYGIRLPS